jgi:hypothetical protein
MQHAPAPNRSLAGLVALADHRLSVSGGGRAGLVGAGLVVLLAAGEILATPPGMDAAAIAVGAVAMLAWLGVGPALLAAGGQERRDQVDGVARLAALRGHPSNARVAARMLGVVRLALRRVGLLGMALCLLGASVSGEVTSLPRRLVGIVGFSLLLGAVAAVVTESCVRIGGRRATSLLIAVVVVPWALAEPLGRPGWSLPAGLEAALERWTGTTAGVAFPLSSRGRWW